MGTSSFLKKSYQLKEGWNFVVLQTTGHIFNIRVLVSLNCENINFKPPNSVQSWSFV